ncbi:MAG: prepilin-type N-terminal cleavage/methylation domain-containing protein [Sulfuritalea sp.]|nr:prepilin-type N-terminal cleavage/methylation domain-containing protein [Sulfuritalea sp.]
MKQQSGFTLVEIAIVLVIIGLLLGGVLKGQELINSAKVKNFANDIRNISTFIYAYQDRFRALPGDDPRANTNFTGGQLGPAATIGNARINGAWNSAAIADETALFWQHVRLAGLATGTTVLPASGAAGDAYFPRNADGGRIGVTGDPVTPAGVVWAANFFVCMSGVQGRFVRQLDTTLDDGNTQTGTLRVIGPGEVAALVGPSFVAVGPADDATLFTVCQAN